MQYMYFDLKNYNQWHLSILNLLLSKFIKRMKCEKVNFRQMKNFVKGKVLPRKSRTPKCRVHRTFQLDFLREHEILQLSTWRSKRRNPIVLTQILSLQHDFRAKYYLFCIHRLEAREATGKMQDLNPFIFTTTWY